MTAKEYLNSVRRKREHCRQLEERRQELEAQAAGLKAIVYDKDRVQTSPENRMESIMVKLAALDEKYAKTIAEYHEAQLKLEQQLQGMKNPMYAEVLTLRYAVDDRDGRQMSFERIACTMYKSYEWVRHLHGEALQEFQRMYLKKTTQNNTF